MRNIFAPLALLATVTVVAAEPPAKRDPNIVIIFTDDQGYGDVGCYGAKDLRTPNIDRLAREGMRFTDFYVAQPVCSSSRTALLTGCYPNRLGITGALNPSSRHGIHDDETTIAGLLQTRLYATGIFGKWHLGHHPKFLPTRHGFDEYFGLPYSNDMWPSHPTSKFPPLPLIDGVKTIATNPDQSQLTTQYTERAVGFIEKNKEHPFFLYLPHTMPHVPLFVSDKFRGKSKRGLYGDVIEEIDWSVGQVLDALKKHGLEENTLVLFSCDNGPWLSYGNHGGSSGGLREGKQTCFEGGVRVPFLARWPGRIPAGSVCREPAMTIDFLPTIAHITGIPLPPRKLDGKSIWPLLTGEKGAKSPHDALCFYWLNELHAIRSGKWKLHLPHPYPSLETPGKDGKPGKLVQKRIELALFDLENDPNETRDVAEQNPDVVKRLQEHVEKARDDLGDGLTKRAGKGKREPGRIPD